MDAWWWYYRVENLYVHDEKKKFIEIDSFFNCKIASYIREWNTHAIEISLMSIVLML